MKRKLILLLDYNCFSCGFGALLHSPPSMIECVTGAAPEVSRRLKPPLVEALVFSAINMMSDKL